jgi:SAM-dependent methyltransferase
MPFKEASFDVVISEFVSQFLDKERAFSEFLRVLKPNGCAGINEMYRDSRLEPPIEGKINEAEIIFSEVTGLNFSMHTPEEWKYYFEETGFKKIKIYKHRPYEGLKDMASTLKAMGGILNTVNIILRMMKYMVLSKSIRMRFKKLDKGKRILFNNRSTRKHAGYILGVARKSPDVPETNVSRTQESKGLLP